MQFANMEHPVKEIPHIINRLTEGSPREQQTALETYFVKDAAFYHPLCQVPSIKSFNVPLLGEVNSRWIIWMVYRWYKILSPKIFLTVNSVVYDQKHNLLYVNMTQIFTPIFYLFLYHAEASLVTVLKLSHDSPDGKYYIQSQEDMYQSNEILKFILPGAGAALMFQQWFASFLCIVCALLFTPITFLMERQAAQKKQ